MGLFNFIVGLWLLSAAPVSLGLDEGFIAALAGALLLGVYLALHFGAVRAKRPP